MTATTTRPSPLRVLLPAAILGALVAVVWSRWTMRQEVHQLQEQFRSAEQTLERVLAEVTRMRIEQRAEGRGVHALLEKLRAYAPVLANARTAAPEHEFARREIDAVLRAIDSLDGDAYPVIHDALLQTPTADFEQCKWLLEAAVRADRERGLELVQKILQGYHADVPVTPRLRWYAADLLLEHDQPRAQRLLRDIMTYESVHGIDPGRAPAAGIPVTGSAAASSGFHNFVARYLHSEDPQREDTLIMVLGRAEHDLITVQECVKALGALKARKAVKAIERVYRNPPAITENPLFLNHCVDALVDIQGRDACAWLTEELKRVTNEMVANRLRHHLHNLGC